MKTKLHEGSAITVYGASSENIRQEYKGAAFEAGRLIALSGHPLVCGGGRQGLMRAAIDGALSAGGETVGVLPSFMVEKAWQHPGLTRMIETPTMHVRKETMARLSRGVIACPGGCGTFEELLEIITWRQLGLYGGNVVILNVGGYYDPLLDLFRRASEEGFMRSTDAGPLFYVADSAADAVAMAVGDPAASSHAMKNNR